MLDKFSTTVEKIYAAASGEPWEEALHAIEDLTGSAGAVIGFVPTDESGAAFNLAGRFTAEQCATYSTHYQPICRRTQYMVDHPYRDAIYDSLLITEQEMNSDPVYDWFAQHDLRYFVGTLLPATRSHNVVFSLQRSRAQGHVQSDDLRLFRQIKAHLSRGVALSDQIQTLRSHKRFGSALFEALPQAVFALDSNGHVCFANAAAASLIGRADGIAVAGGRLATLVPVEQTRLDRLIVEAAGIEAISSSGWAKVSRQNGAMPYAVFVAPLQRPDDDFSNGAASVVVIVHDPCSRKLVDPQMLVSLYGLTETEARLANAISVGHSIESAAASLNMRVTTARSHLKSIFAKIGVNRQQDLVRLLTSLSSIAI